MLQAHADLVAAYNRCDAARFVGSYAERFSFITSNTPRPVADVAGLRRYLAAGCDTRPNPTATVVQQRVRFAAGQALLFGQYLFRVPRSGQTFDLLQNFTLLMQPIGGRWLIVAHHVSVSPQPAGQ